MKTFLIVAVAVAISGAAFAKDLKGSVMTDSEMDKVTAGEIPCAHPTGCGIYTGNAASNGVLANHLTPGSSPEGASRHIQQAPAHTPRAL